MTGDAAEMLIRASAGSPAHLDSGELRAAIANAMVGLKKRFYGKGPTKAKTYINDNYIFCVLEGGLTRNEETLVQAGAEDLVRDYRLRFQEVVLDVTKQAIAELTGREVVNAHSQIVFNPDRVFEIFVLDGPPLHARPSSDGARPSLDGARHSSDGARSSSDGARPNSDGARPNSDGASADGSAPR
ncbi:MAG: DUF2294 domain-containing protein [Thermoleophilaceae bacterium]